jgi:hypothetical protein
LVRDRFVFGMIHFATECLLESVPSGNVVPGAKQAQGVMKQVPLHGALESVGSDRANGSSLRALRWTVFLQPQRGVLVCAAATRANGD